MENLVNIVGTCLQMCSDSEKKFREKNGLLHYFEIDHSCKSENKAFKAIKEFSRSAAGKELLDPSNLRPSHVLLKTINYLIKEIVPRTELPRCAVYDFVNDRIQAIRQDLTVQNIEDTNAVNILECCVKFYVVESYILCEEEQIKFDQHLNDQQLTISLEKLFNLYRKFESHNISEFIGIYFIRNVQNTEKYYLSIKAFSNYLPEKNIKLTIQTCNAYLLKNFVKFFRLVEKLPLLLILCFSHYFASIRSQALDVLNVAFSSNLCKFPVNTLSEWLWLPDKKTIELCKNYNLNIHDGNICFNKKNFKNGFLAEFQKEAYADDKLRKVSLEKLINVNDFIE